MVYALYYVLKLGFFNTLMARKREVGCHGRVLRKGPPGETGLGGERDWDIQASRKRRSNQPPAWSVALGLEGGLCKMFQMDSRLLLSLWNLSHQVKPSEESEGCFVERDSGSSPGFHHRI